MAKLSNTEKSIIYQLMLSQQCMFATLSADVDVFDVLIWIIVFINFAQWRKQHLDTKFFDPSYVWKPADKSEYPADLRQKISDVRLVDAEFFAELEGDANAMAGAPRHLKKKED